MTSDIAALMVDDRVVALSVGSLILADSPRLAGEDAAHVRMLAEVYSKLPPIIVHRRTMRIVDGMHRARAAMLRGQESIDARLFEGSQSAAFVLSVRENTAHGLPLSLADRKAAAARIMTDFPEWSDRAIASMAGLGHSTVSAIRRHSASGGAQPRSRIGRDGRVRPVEIGESRRRAAELIAARPDASVREVAKEARVSVGTAHSIRRQADEIRQQIDRAASDPGGAPQRRRMLAQGGWAGADRVGWDVVRRQLRADPALRYTESGRRLLQWFESRAIDTDGWVDMAETVPPRWSEILARLARQFSREWQDFAGALQERGDTAD